MVSLRQFDRGVRVTLTPEGLPPVVINPLLPVGVGRPPQPQLRVSFSVRKSVTGEPQRAKVTITNLGRATRELIAQGVRTVDQVLLARPNPGLIDQRFAVPVPPNIVIEAGYNGAAGAIFTGVATRLQSGRSGGVEWVTEIEASDAGVGLDLGVASRTYAAPVPAVELVAYLAQVMGVVPSPVVPLGLANAQPIALPKAVVGRARDILDALCRGLELQWFAEDSVLYLLDRPPAAGVNSVPGPPVRLSALPDPSAARLLDKPVRLASGGVAARALLNPTIRPGREVTLLSDELAGRYRVEVVEHAGDNRSGGFETSVVLRDLLPVLAL